MPVDALDPVTTGLDPIQKLSRDLRLAAKTLSRDEARYLVEAYYTMQEDRMRSHSQVRALDKVQAPHLVLSWFGDNAELLERNIKQALEAFSDRDVTGRWAKSITGIGPVIAAGLSAYVDIEKCQTAGNLWSFAGLNPDAVWAKGQKRPWNAALKVLTWKIGESFVKVSTNDHDVYGHLWAKRRAYEWEKNLRGALVEQAVGKLEKFAIKKTTEAYAWYAGCFTAAQAQEILATPAEQRQGVAARLKGDPGSGQPMLAPAHVHARAKRWAVKLFLAHWFTVAYVERFGQMPPSPYPFSQLEGHTHEHPVPLWPFTTPIPAFAAPPSAHASRA